MLLCPVASRREAAHGVADETRANMHLTMQTQLGPLAPGGAAVSRGIFSQHAAAASKRHIACKAISRGQPSQGGDSIDAEWQQVRLQPLWQSLDAQLDRCWASQDQAAAQSIEDSWDSGDIADSYSTSTSTPALGSLSSSSTRGGGLDTLWPLVAQPTGFSYSGRQQTLLKDLSQVYVILFGVESADTEGIYSLRVMSRDDGLPQDTIVAFSCKADAERYSGLLEATMDHVPSVCPLEPAELLEFCSDSGYSYRVESKGSLLIPPDYYVGMTDWERLLRLREGKWTVRERNLISPPTPAASESDASPAPAPEPLMSNNANYYPLSSDYLLEEARARLERLL